MAMGPEVTANEALDATTVMLVAVISMLATPPLESIMPVVLLIVTSEDFRLS